MFFQATHHALECSERSTIWTVKEELTSTKRFDGLVDRVFFLFVYFSTTSKFFGMVLLSKYSLFYFNIYWYLNCQILLLYVLAA